VFSERLPRFPGILPGFSPNKNFGGCACTTTSYTILRQYRRHFAYSYSQGRINHSANRANARGLTLEYQSTSLIFMFLGHASKMYSFLITAFSIQAKETNNFGTYRF